jgi:polyphosphate kinase
LIVRGACALRPSVRGVSSRIRVRSVIGRFLEHSRIFLFGNGGESEVYLGSADWMPRNLHERVEVMFRLKDADLCRSVCAEILAPYLADTEKARFLLSNGAYARAHQLPSTQHAANGTRFNVQEFFMRLAAHPEGINGFSLAEHLGVRTPAPIVAFLESSAHSEPDKIG